MKYETKLLLAQLLQYTDCKSISGQGIVFLEELLDMIFNQIASGVMKYAEANSRTKPTWRDALYGLDRICSIEELEEYCKQEAGLDHELAIQPANATIAPETVEIPNQPSALESQSFNEDPHGKIASKRVAVPKYFPPFPPPHSYLQTKTPLHPIDEDMEIRKKRIQQSSIMEENLKRLLLKSFSVSGFKPLIGNDFGYVDFLNPSIP